MTLGGNHVIQLHWEPFFYINVSYDSSDWSALLILRQIVGKLKYPTLGHQTSMYQ